MKKHTKTPFAYKGHFIRREKESGLWEVILKPGLHFEGDADGITDGSHTSLSDSRAEARAEVNDRVIGECHCPTCTDPYAKTYHDQLLTGEIR